MFCAKYTFVLSVLVTVWIALRPFGSVKSRRSPFFTAGSELLPDSHPPSQPPLPSGHRTVLTLTVVSDEPSMAISGCPLAVPNGLTDSGAPRQESRIGSTLRIVMMSVAGWFTAGGSPLPAPVVIAVIVVALTLSKL